MKFLEKMERKHYALMEENLFLGLFSMIVAASVVAIPIAFILKYSSMLLIIPVVVIAAYTIYRFIKTPPMED